MNLVSIICPSYNKATYIEQTIMSVLNQSHQNWELIIIDDNSKDNSINVIERFLSDSRIHLIKLNENKGANYNRNLGIKKAKGDFIIFLDADDLLMTTCLEMRLKKAIEFPDANLLVFSMGVFQKQIGDSKNKNWTPDTKSPLEDFLQDKLPWSILQPLWKRDFLISLGGFDGTFTKLQDVELHTRALLHTVIKLKTFPEILDCYYRIDDNRKNFNAFDFLLRRVKSAKLYCNKYENTISIMLKKYLYGTIIGTYETVTYCLKTKEISLAEFKLIEAELFSCNLMRHSSTIKKICFKFYYYYSYYLPHIPGIKKVFSRLIIR